MAVTRRHFLIGGALLGATAIGSVLWDWSRQISPHLSLPRLLQSQVSIPGGSVVDVVLVGARQQIATAATPATFSQAMAHWLQAIPRTANAPRLIVFPEDVGLITAFSGLRGDLARHLGSSRWAMASLLAAYAPQIGSFHRQYPQVPLPPSNLRLLWMALAETMVPTFLDAFQPLARKYGAYLIACIPCPPFEPISGHRQNRIRVTEPNIYNTAFVFHPDGRVTAEVRKVHLVSVERTLLSLSPGKLEDLHAIALPGLGSIGIVISKDAWMPDVLDRLSEEGAEILVQPDANNGPWATRPVLTNWQPDAWKSGNWAAVQKYSGFQYNFNPMMTGNLFDIPFDGQSAIVAKVSPGQTPLGYIGQAADGGFVAVAPWAYPDPVHLPLQERRRALAADSQALAPTSGSPRQNHYRSVLLESRITLLPANRPVPVEGTLTRVTVEEIDGEKSRPRWSPTLASASGGPVYLAYLQSFNGHGVVCLAQSPDGIAPFNPLGPVDQLTTAPQWQPALAVDSRGILYVAWIDARTGSWEVRLAVSHDQGKSFRPSRLVATPSGQPLATAPHLTLSPLDTLVITWSDNRLANGVGDIYAVSSHDGGQSFSQPLRVSDTPVRLVDRIPFGIGYGWNPAVAATTPGMASLWQDFRPLSPGNPTSRRNHIRGTLFAPGAAVPAPSQPVAVNPHAQQYLPRLTRFGLGGWLAAWLERADASRATAIAMAEATIEGSDFHWLPWKIPPVVGRQAQCLVLSATFAAQPEVRLAWTTDAGSLSWARRSKGRWMVQILDGGLGETASNPSLLPLPNGTLLLAWQSRSSTGQPRIVCARP